MNWTVEETASVVSTLRIGYQRSSSWEQWVLGLGRPAHRQSHVQPENAETTFGASRPGIKWRAILTSGRGPVRRLRRGKVSRQA